MLFAQGVQLHFIFGQDTMDESYPFDDPLLEGFSILEAPPEKPGELAHLVNISSYFKDTLAPEAKIDHTLCTECKDELFDLMVKEININFEELREYQENLKQLSDEPFEEDLEHLTKQLEEQRRLEEKLKLELASVRIVEKTVSSVLEKQICVKERLDKEVDMYRKNYAAIIQQAISYEEELICLEAKRDHAKGQIEKLKKSNALEATFNIGINEDIATINCFKLGHVIGRPGRSSPPINWIEINAAWGQVTLLLSALARKVNLEFKDYRLVPYGNHSFIEIKSDNKLLPLFSSEANFTFRCDSNFDSAMAAFLECLKQLKEAEKENSSPICLPYPIDRGKLGEHGTGNTYSIKMLFNSEEHWTKSLKLLLTNLKWAMFSCNNQKERKVKKDK